MAAAELSTHKPLFASRCPPLERCSSGASDLLHCNASCLHVLQSKAPAMRWRSKSSCAPECRRAPRIGSLQFRSDDLAVCNADTITSGGHFFRSKGLPSPPPKEHAKSSWGLAARKGQKIGFVLRRKRAGVRIQPALTSGGAHVIVDGRPEPIPRDTSAVVEDARCGQEGRRFLGSMTTDSPGAQRECTEKEERARVAAEQVRFAACICPCIPASCFACVEKWCTHTTTIEIAGCRLAL
jgi:hypothetical protein